MSKAIDDFNEDQRTKTTIIKTVRIKVIPQFQRIVPVDEEMTIVWTKNQVFNNDNHVHLRAKFTWNTRDFLTPMLF